MTLLHGMLAATRPILILSPPRCSSTALARTLLQHSAIGQYIHEPCDRYRHESAGLASIASALKELPAAELSLIKEMTFQLGTSSLSRTFLQSVRAPLIFLVRDPRLCVASRIRMMLEDLVRSQPANSNEDVRAAIANQDYRSIDPLLPEARFPLTHTGWSALESQLALCRELHLDHVILDATDFRRDARTALVRLCERLRLDFEPAMLNWDPSIQPLLRGLPHQRHWYEAVMQSRGIERPNESCPPAQMFPRRFQNHLVWALSAYKRILADRRNLMPEWLALAIERADDAPSRL